MRVENGPETGFSVSRCAYTGVSVSLSLSFRLTFGVPTICADDFGNEMQWLRQSYLTVYQPQSDSGDSDLAMN